VSLICKALTSAKNRNRVSEESCWFFQDYRVIIGRMSVVVSHLNSNLTQKTFNSQMCLVNLLQVSNNHPSIHYLGADSTRGDGVYSGFLLSNQFSGNGYYSMKVWHGLSNAKEGSHLWCWIWIAEAYPLSIYFVISEVCSIERVTLWLGSVWVEIQIPSGYKGSQFWMKQLVLNPVDSLSCKVLPIRHILWQWEKAVLVHLT